MPEEGHPEEEQLKVDATLVRDSVTVGSPVAVRVELANYDPTRGRVTLELRADGSVVAERTVAVGASTERTVTVGGRLREPGEYAVVVNGIGVGSVAVAGGSPEPMPGTDAPGVPPGTARPDAGGSVRTVEVTLGDRSTNGTASADLDDSLRSESVELRRIGVSTGGDGGDGGAGEAAASFVVTPPTGSVPEDAPELDAGAAVQYFTLRPTDDSGGDYGTVELGFGVDGSALPSGTTPEAVVLYHYADGAWVALPTAYDARTGTYTATVDGFSLFAVGVPADAVRGDDPTEASRLTEVAGLSPATQSPDGPAGPPARTIPWLFWSGLGGAALLSVLFLARRRVPYGSSWTGRREEGTSAPGGGADDRTPGGPDDD